MPQQVVAGPCCRLRRRKCSACRQVCQGPIWCEVIRDQLLAFDCTGTGTSPGAVASACRNASRWKSSGSTSVPTLCIASAAITYDVPLPLNVARGVAEAEGAAVSEILPSLLVVSRMRWPVTNVTKVAVCAGGHRYAGDEVGGCGRRAREHYERP
jgi:hypothetical protein